MCHFIYSDFHENFCLLNPLSVNSTKWSHIQTIRRQTHSNNSSTNCLSVFDHFVKLALKELKEIVEVRDKYKLNLDIPKWNEKF